MGLLFLRLVCDAGVFLPELFSFLGRLALLLKVGSPKMQACDHRTLDCGCRGSGHRDLGEHCAAIVFLPGAQGEELLRAWLQVLLRFSLPLSLRPLAQA